MTEVHRYWTNLKEPVLVAVVALAEAADLAEEVAAVLVVVVVVAAVAVAALEGVDHPAWEDCSRLECRS